jgi:hypothetical protein
MKLSSPIRFGLVASIIVMGLLSSGLAQMVQDTSDIVPALTTGLAHKNVQGSSMAVRSPGKMVQDRVAQLQDVTAPPPASITAVEEPGPYDLFMAGLVEMLLSALQDLLTAIADLFFPRGGVSDDCGDDFCDVGETVANCPDDCITGGQACGDDFCDVGETVANCPDDCNADGQACGDDFCDVGETVANCPDDCITGGQACGDGTCDTGETVTNCPDDCNRGRLKTRH